MIDDAGARAGDGEADCTHDRRAPRRSRSCSTATSIPTGAFMSGRLAVEGDMGLAMKLASLLG